MLTSTRDPHTSNLPRSEYRIDGQVVQIASLSTETIASMYALMTTYYNGMTREIFEQDLYEKEQVVLLNDACTGTICGFSTTMTMRIPIDGRDVVTIFSGDTIVHERYRHQTVLPRLWLQLAYSTADAIQTREPETRVYWFLISSGYKTYCYLPLFFREFYPTFERSTPPHLQRLIDTIARWKYPEEYESRTGIVRLKYPSPLREGVAPITERRLKNPHVAFFQQVNPDHGNGDELVCITEINTSNLTKAGQRMVNARTTDVEKP